MAAVIDQESLDLIIQLQLQDVQRLSKGKGRHHDTPRDLDLAMQLYRAELESLDSFIADRVMSQSIARAVIQDADAIAEQVRPEEQPRRRRGRGRKGKQPATRMEAYGLSSHPGEDDVDPEVLLRLQAMYMDDCDIVPGDQPESSSWAASRRHPPATSTTSSPSLFSPVSSSNATSTSAQKAGTAPRKTCTACSDLFPAPDVSRCPCSHEYCRGCIAQLFRAAMKDESLFPPRCCGQQIPVDQDRAFLPAKVQEEFRAKAIEYGTPNRTYCHRPTCSAFIPVSFIRGDQGGCAKCGSLTCTVCKGAAHQEDCPEDTATQELLRVARENGWQRCRDCKRMVELNTGCNHITCHCGSQFCYVCGARWKTCQCPQWDEDNLVERAENVVNRDAVAEQYDAAQHARAVRQVRRDLQNYHNCDAHRWRSRGGRFRCDECRNMMPQYIYECNECRILACRSCRYNRL